LLNAIEQIFQPVRFIFLRQRYIFSGESASQRAYNSETTLLVVVIYHVPHVSALVARVNSVTDKMNRSVRHCCIRAAAMITA
jgi:hypothetical protein